MRMLIVLVNYNGSGLTIDCLKSLAPELAELPDVAVGVCDNGSEPEDYRRLDEGIADLAFGDRVELVRLERNQGFTGGNNVVIRAALASDSPPDAVMLLNNDTLVRPGAIQELYRFMESRPDVGVCGCRLEYPDGESQRAARRVLTAASEFESYARLGVVSRLLGRWLVAPPEPTSHEPQVCGWIPGAALAVRREVLERVGLLDEGLYTYFDDVDYCLRAKRAGFPTWYLPTSRIVHLVGKTTGVTAEQARPKRRPEYWFHARRRYFLKSFGPIGAAAADLAAMAGLFLWKARVFVTRKPDPDPPQLFWDLARNGVFARGFRVREVLNPGTGAPVASAEEPIIAARPPQTTTANAT